MVGFLTAFDQRQYRERANPPVACDFSTILTIPR